MGSGCLILSSRKAQPGEEAKGQCKQDIPIGETGEAYYT
jgi:hypothetical protein